MNKIHFYVSIVDDQEFHVIAIWNRDRTGVVYARCKRQETAEHICELLNSEQSDIERRFLEKAKAVKS